MEKLSVTLPERFSDVDPDTWADQALCMLQNADWDIRPHFLVGLEEPDMWRNARAFYHVMGVQGVPLIHHKRVEARQCISSKGIAEMDNVFIFGGYRPDTFFDLMEGCFAIPMDASIDAISGAYDAGEPILVVQLKVKDSYVSVS